MTIYSKGGLFRMGGFVEAVAANVRTLIATEQINFPGMKIMAKTLSVSSQQVANNILWEIETSDYHYSENIYTVTAQASQPLPPFNFRGVGAIRIFATHTGGLATTLTCDFEGIKHVP